MDDVFAEERKNNVVNLRREGVPVRHVEVFGWQYDALEHVLLQMLVKPNRRTKVQSINEL